MKILKVNTFTGEKLFCKYPNIDINVKINVADTQYYSFIENEYPEFDSNYQKVSEEIILTDELYNDISHIKIAIREFTVSELTTAQIIENLNNSLGKHLDNNYPHWEQSKHSGKSLRYLNTILSGGTPTNEDSNYINEKVLILADWTANCRLSRDEKEIELLTNNKIPSFEWEERPI